MSDYRAHDSQAAMKAPACFAGSPVHRFADSPFRRFDLRLRRPLAILFPHDGACCCRRRVGAARGGCAECHLTERAADHRFNVPTRECGSANRPTNRNLRRSTRSRRSADTFVRESDPG